MKHTTLPLVTAAFASCSFAAFAGEPSLRGSILTPQPPSERWADGDYFFGTWGGARPQLAEKGITFESYYVANPAGLASGGKTNGNGFTYVDNFYLGVTFDLEKLIGWTGAQFAVSGINRSGGSLTLANVGSQYDVQQVHGGQNVFLYNVTLEQRFWQDKAKIKIGRFGASDDFNSSPIYGLYMNNGIDGNIRNVLFDTQFSAYPFATWAARLRIDPTPEVNFQLGVYQTKSDIFDRRKNGLDWSISGDDGVMLLAQLGWTPEFFKRPVAAAGEKDFKSDGKTAAAEPQMKGLPGHYWLGGSYSPWKGYSQFGQTEKTTGSYGFYAHADQMIYQEAPGSEQGLTLFVASGYYPQDNISIIPWQLNVGAFYTGLFPGRERDKTIIGFIHGQFGDDYADSIALTGSTRPTRENVLEIAHRIQLTKFAYLQPDVQFVSRPGGTGQIDDAVVVGAQVGISF
jgi:porin